MIALQSAAEASDREPVFRVLGDSVVVVCVGMLVLRLSLPAKLDMGALSPCSTVSCMHTFHVMEV